MAGGPKILLKNFGTTNNKCTQHRQFEMYKSRLAQMTSKPKVTHPKVLIFLACHFSIDMKMYIFYRYYYLVISNKFYI